jgi:subtilisin family serine protease
MRSRLSDGRRALARVLGLGTVAAVAVLGVGSAVSAQTQPATDRTSVERAIPQQIADLKLDEPVSATGVTADVLRPGVIVQSGGRVVVRLSNESGAQAFGKGNSESAAKAAAKSQQDDFLSRLKAIDSSAKVLARTQMVMNAVFVQVDASKLEQIAKDPAVVRIAPIGNYELDLSETVPYIGAKAVQDAGITGKGVKVAVIDSGVDYTHAEFGGAGAAAYATNNPNIVEPGTFPTAKVKGGFDFIGSTWTGAQGGPAEAPDPDPLDDGNLNPANNGVGHGTHVADIIGGKRGVAPGVDLYALKVCSTVTTSCSGLGLIEAMEWTVDPNGDGNFKDRMNLINMSLGSDYGQPFDDDLSLAVENATKVGILTVSAAGNGSDKPYVAGTPASTESALSVAQTAVPSAFLPLMQILAPANIAGSVPAVFQPWSVPLTAPIQGPVQYGNGAGGNLDGCAAFTAGSLTGKIVLVNRGTCNFSLKIKNIGQAGGLIGIIGLIAPGDPFEGAFGGDSPQTIPGYMISQTNANRLRAGLPNTVVRFDPAVGIPLKGSIVGSSSRGPQHESTQRIKPEIGAPGASVSAVAGSGTENEPFGGTSGASPMVAGSAALLLEGFGGTKTTGKGTANGKAIGLGLKPIEVKSLLMNNAETNIISNPLTGALAEITRIGGGEVRVNQALDAPVAAWDDDVPTAALGFGFVDVTDTVAFKKTVRIRNYDNTKRTYTITPTFRFANDQANGAVSLTAPATVEIKPGRGRDTTFEVTLTVDGSKLPGNSMNSGSNGASPASLTANEYDGYLKLSDGTDTLTIPWQVLPRKAAKVVPSSSTINPPAFPASQTIGLDNQGAGKAQVDAYSLIATSPNIPEGPVGGQSPTPDIRAVGINTFIVPAGSCGTGTPAQFIWAFAINTWERQEHLLPVSHQVSLDTNQDGTADFLVLNRDASGLGTITDGRQLTWAVNLHTGAASALFFAEHSMNTGNTVLYVCAQQIGMGIADVLSTNVDMAVVAQDFYYGGPGDEVDDLTVTPFGERFVGAPTDVPGKTNDADALSVFDFGLFPGNTPELGLMLVTNGDRGSGARGGATKDTEALLLQTP